LFDPAVWGCGYATEGLHWLHGHLRDHYRCYGCLPP
jgi:hypothetical protein